MDEACSPAVNVDGTAPTNEFRDLEDPEIHITAHVEQTLLVLRVLRFYPAFYRLIEAHQALVGRPFQFKKSPRNDCVLRLRFRNHLSCTTLQRSW
jgi:hypothetical protein